MDDQLAEKPLRKFAEAVADLSPMLDTDGIQPETKAALSKLLSAICKFVEKSEAEESFKDGLRRLLAT